MPSRKTSRNGFDYAAAQYSDPRYARSGGGYATVGHYSGYTAYPYTQLLSRCPCVCMSVSSGHSFLKACTAMFIVLNDHYGGSLSAPF